MYKIMNNYSYGDNDINENHSIGIVETEEEAKIAVDKLNKKFGFNVVFTSGGYPRVAKRVYSYLEIESFDCDKYISSQEITLMPQKEFSDKAGIPYDEYFKE